MRVQIVEVHLFQAVGRHFAVDVGSRKRNPNKFTEVKVWCCSEGLVAVFLYQVYGYWCLALSTFSSCRGYQNNSAFNVLFNASSL